MDTGKGSRRHFSGGSQRQRDGLSELMLLTVAAVSFIAVAAYAAGMSGAAEEVTEDKKRYYADCSDHYYTDYSDYREYRVERDAYLESLRAEPDDPGIVELPEEIPEPYEPDSSPEPGLMLMKTTAYCYGDITYTGQKAREGIAAGKKDWIGKAALIYEAVPHGSGYETGELIGIYELQDIGYGKDSKDGVKSSVRSDKESRGTIERGECLDIYRTSYDRCVDWMKETGGMVFVQIIPAEG